MISTSLPFHVSFLLFLAFISLHAPRDFPSFLFSFSWFPVNVSSFRQFSFISLQFLSCSAMSLHFPSFLTSSPPFTHFSLHVPNSFGASSASSTMMLAMLGVLSSRLRGEMPHKSLKIAQKSSTTPEQIRKPFAPCWGGHSAKRMRMVLAWSSHGPRHGPRMVLAWSSHGPRMVGGMGRTAYHAPGWARSRPVAGFKGCRPVPPAPAC